ncbi:SLAM family member 5-like [Pelobates cultripes]|uniref:SLAM family member 5-like n=1 Tax=Pelobates cultripes TaxID=61616 RepID=A0AAD1WUM3_PELCU|nr:SLAM family member 5-like [Pelobates cultripes]
MMCLYFWILLLSSLQTGILCAVQCGDKRTVNGAVGGDVILPVSQTGIKDISWVIVNGGTHFATTKPDGDIDIRDNRYKGRLYRTADGSLNFTKLTREDQREYTANIRTDPGNKQCEQQYDLRVFKKILPEDFEILPTVTTNVTCIVTLLCKVNGSEVIITWSRPDGSNINVINGSLLVSDTNTSYTCTAQNPVSNSSKTVIPQTYCNKENGSTGNKQSQLRNTAVIASPLAIGAVAFIGVGALIANRKNRKKRKIEVEELAPTTYVEVQQKQQTQNVIPENSGQQKNVTAQTLYSEVQHPKKPEKPQRERVNNSEQNIKPEKTDVNTLYSVINSVKHKQEDSKETTVYDTIK